MRRIIPYTLALPILLAAGCTSPDQEVSADPPTVEESVTDPGSEPQDPPEETEEDDGEGTVDGDGTAEEFAFGEGAAFPYPVGAYEEEFQDGVEEDGVEEDVVYTVDDVALSGPGQVGFTLTVEVPELGRVFGTGHLDVQCSYEEYAGPATSEAPLGELETGTHTADMVCDAPDAPDSVLVSVSNGEDEADFRGPVG